ncbi:MAG: FeoB-associated Cys-rich membrane protein [Proteobacteria bacterium]|nr:FeoB-associated Cys-rich membrane protein [Pseudomonadota bacterium]
MNGSFDLSLVLAIVGVAAIYLLRRYLRRRKDGSQGCGCDTGCANCGSGSSCSQPRKSDELPMDDN